MAQNWLRFHLIGGGVSTFYYDERIFGKKTRFLTKHERWFEKSCDVKNCAPSKKRKKIEMEKCLI
jgi:hypothetical protein